MLLLGEQRKHKCAHTQHTARSPSLSPPLAPSPALTRLEQRRDGERRDRAVGVGDEALHVDVAVGDLWGSWWMVDG